MPNIVNIEILSNPTHGSNLNFTITCAAIGYVKNINKTFVGGMPVAVNQVKIGVNYAATMANLNANLQLNDTDVNTSFLYDAVEYIEMLFATPETYIITVTNDAGATFTVEALGYTIPTTETLPDFSLKDISIEIIDTYTNDLPLIIEKTSVNACVLKYKGGDDILQSIKASELSFNMLVENAEDAHFLHLFTGDEKRYIVKVNAIDEADNVQLIWKGFLLPDEYKEPYKNVNFFVDFTATDMLAVLKGKYLKPWVYENTFPIGQILAMLLKETGLNQNILVSPSIVHQTLDWDKICVDLRTYISGDKLTNCNDVLQDLLKSNLLSIYNYRGYWFIEGFSQNRLETITYYQFDTSGIRIEDLIVVKNIKTTIYEAGSVNFSAIPPYKKVNVKFKANGTSNLFTPAAIKLPEDELFFTSYKTANYTGTVYPEDIAYQTNHFQPWIDTLNYLYTQISFNKNQLAYRFNHFAFDIPYILTEAEALTKYIECREQPFVKPGILYEFELQFKVDKITTIYSANEMTGYLQSGEFDKLFPFQIFKDNIEIYSNRPSFSSEIDLRYETSITSGPDSDYIHTITFKLKFQFRVETTGYIKFRMLMPISNIEFLTYLFFPLASAIGEIIKLSATEGYDVNENLIAVRDINFTKELDFDINFTSSADTSIINSFKLNAPIDTNYIAEIDTTTGAQEIIDYHYFSPVTALELVLQVFNLTVANYQDFYYKKLFNKIYLENIDQSKESFNSLWLSEGGIARLGYLKSFDGYPVIPKKYKAYPSVPVDSVLKIFDVKYPIENLSLRELWKINNSLITGTYAQMIAHVLHYCFSETSFRLEATAKELIFPHDILNFNYNSEDKIFLPTTLTIDLFEGNTVLVASESSYQELTDIIYE